MIYIEPMNYDAPKNDEGGKWRSFKDDFPDWTDAPHSIHLRTKDGNVIVARLKIADTGFNGQDEYPIFAACLSDGSEVDMFGFDEFRIV